MVGLIKPTGGRILLDGCDIAALPQEERATLPRRIQMVFQDPYGSLNPRFSVEKTLAEVLAFHRVVPREEIHGEVRRLMDLVGLSSSLAVRLPRHLSGGQRQVVAISRAIYFNARILIMDEPTAALGPEETAMVGNLIHQLKAEGVGIFLISHDMHDVFALSDRLAVMKNGKRIGTYRTQDVTEDEVLGMIIAGKAPAGKEQTERPAR